MLEETIFYKTEPAITIIRISLCFSCAAAHQQLFLNPPPYLRVHHGLLCALLQSAL